MTVRPTPREEMKDTSMPVRIGTAPMMKKRISSL